MGALRLVEGSTLGPEDLARVQEIYEAGFPEEWLRSPFEELFADEVLVLLDQDDAPVGLSVVRALGPTGWTFVRYFVAGPRGQGIGSRLWEALAQNRIRRGDRRILLDVEDPEESGIDGAEQSIRRRRIVFYERLGLLELPVEDYVPPHDGGAHPLRLMVADLPGPTTAPDEADLREVVLGVFAHRYGVDATHPAATATLRASGL